MGLFNRIHRITVARVETFLQRVEDPELLMPRLVREMDAQLAIAAETEGKAVAALRAAQREATQLERKAASLQDGAAAALKAGDEQTARAALESAIDAETALSSASANVQRAQEVLDQARHARQHVARQLDELKRRRGEIVTRSRVARTRRKINHSIRGGGGSTDSILEAVDRLENAVDEAESELEVFSRLDGDGAVNASLEQRLEQLGRSARVDERLEALKRQLAGESTVRQGQ